MSEKHDDGGPAELSSKRVHAIMSDCLFRNEELPTDGSVPPGAVVAEAVMLRCGMHPERLEGHRSEVEAMLNDLPDAFMENSGGGMSFLNACMDKRGRQWGEHACIDALVALGLGLGVVSFCLPRNLWSMLPGGMPYFVVHPEKRRRAAGGEGAA